MRRTLLMIGALSLALSTMAQAQPGGRDGPTTKPATGEQPVGKPGNGGRPGGGHRPGGGGKPPGGGPGGGQSGGGKPGGGKPGGGWKPGPGKPGGGRPGVGKPGGGKPGGGWKPGQGGRPPHKPPNNHRPPGHRPPNQWHRPRPNQWYWHGRWLGRIRGPLFAYPRGYAYQRWSAGLLLPAIFISAAYYYDGYGSLGLPPPDPGYRWVRYGPDLVLVNLTTGRIMEVAYGVFL